MWPAPQETADLVSFTEEIFNWKLHFLCSDRFALRWGSTHMLIFLSNISKFLKLETGKYAKKYQTYGFFIVLGNVTLIFLRTWPRSKFLWICNSVIHNSKSVHKIVKLTNPLFVSEKMVIFFLKIFILSPWNVN